MDDKRRELIDGIVRLMEGVSFRHCDLTLELAFRLKNFIKRKKGKCHVFSSPVDVCLPKGEEKEEDKIYTVLQPDIFVVCDLSKLEDERRCMGAPDLVVEILSKSTSRYDLTKKFNAYQEAGVREYWVVYQRPKRITVFTLQENGLFDAGREYRTGNVLISSVLQGLSIDIDLLYADASS
jgi:Uma2 family endonuclease